MIGDFNVHWDKAELPHSRQLHDILSELNLYQHVSGPTHCGGHTLDLVIIKNDPSSRLVSALTMQDISVSDHYAFSCHLTTRPRHSASKSHMARKLRSVPSADIAADMRSQLSSINEHSHVNDLIDDYNTIVSEILEKHAPLRKITIKGESCKPWYDETIHEARRKRRQLERKAKKSRLEVHRQMYAVQCQTVVKLINQCKSRVLP